MLKIYKTDNVEKTVKKIKKITIDCWIELTAPTIDEIEKVVAKTKIDKDLILKMLDEEELPRIEQDDNATLIVIDTPFLEENDTTHSYKTYPLGIIITNNNYVVTISPKRTTILNNFRLSKVKNFRTAKKIRFLIQILSTTAAAYQRALKQVNKDIEAKEQILKKSTENNDLIDLLDIEKTLVYFITSLKANQLVLEKLNRGVILPLFEEDLDLLEETIIENKQAIEMSGIYREILSSLAETYGTIVSNNLNGVMKFLAGATIILSIPTMFASFMGMNVPLGPFADIAFGFLIVVGISLLVAIIVAFILKKKNML